MIKKYVTQKEPVLVAWLVTTITSFVGGYGLQFDTQGIVLLTSVVGVVVSTLARSAVWTEDTLTNGKK